MERKRWGSVSGGTCVYRDLSAFGAELRRRRVSRGLSLRTLARKLGLPGHSGLVDYEQGRRLVPAHLLEAFSRVLDDGNGELRRLHDLVLASRADPAPGVFTPERTVPASPFPADLADFVGRERELADVEAWLDRPAAGAASRVLAVSGPPGIGKTSVAVRLAHRLAERRPDVSLYLDLGGSGPAPLDVGQALHRMLVGLGLPETGIPADLDDRAALLRSVLCGRRALILLDDVADERQVRPLIAGGPTITVLTSRNPLEGLDGAHHVPLAGLAPGAAVDLLAAVIGPARVAVEPDAAHELVELCALLPLAIRLLATRLATWPRCPLADRVHDLAVAEQRLDLLRAGDRTVRGVLTAAHDALPDPARRLFRRLSLVPGRHFGVDAAAVALGVTPATAGELLRAVVDAGLAQAAPTPDRYRFHDIVALFAADRCAAEETSADQEKIQADLVSWALTTAARAAGLLDPSGRATPDPDSPLRTARAATRWLDEEIDTVTDAIRRATAAGRADLVHPLTASLPCYLDLRTRWDVMEELGTHARALAVETGDRRQEAVALNCLGLASRESGRPAAAIRYCKQAGLVAGTTGDVLAEGIALEGWGHALVTAHRQAEAVPILRQAVALLATQPHRWYEAGALNQLGRALREVRHHDEAVTRHEEAIAVFQEIGAVRGEGLARTHLGDTLAAAGRLTDAAAAHALAYEHFARDSDEWGQALALRGLTTARLAQGRQVEETASPPEVERRFDSTHDGPGAPRQLLTRIEQVGHRQPAPAPG
ncbi:NB-ARC domain-containing protein [Actinokineospora auranticolor]|uniref:Tetratricopeptide repeat protein n=1 Tax=Actinokineospora auranticolor TaxID=155976 RepID=A0A2S6GEL8_9PSEU|nr:helix-turn-helix domain-containing protein [Actinokineospora auranticolor]PPK63679.1 tetratricopeptide repeat protein [Actinokineospora auranticolor]